MAGRAVGAVVAVACLSFPTAGQQAGDGQGPFRSSARLVQVSVVVQDAYGRPVPGLAAGDFEVREAGIPQRIAHFAAPGDAPPRAPVIAAGGNAFSNVHAGGSAQGATIILFDRLNTRTLHQTQAKRAVIDYLGQLAPDDRIGFYVLEGDRLDILHDFTREAAPLLATLARSGSSVSGARVAADDLLARPDPIGVKEEDAEGAKRLEEWLDRAEGALQDINLDRRMKATLAAFDLLGQRLAGVRGRKNVIWLSDGLPLFSSTSKLSMAEMSRQVQRATRALSDADVAIYPIDTEGLVADVFGHTADRDRPYSKPRALTPAFDTSAMLADQTGGRVFRNTNDLRVAIARASDDSSSTYLLGYYPADRQWDGTFRPIAVRVARRGVQVRHRSGYHRDPPPSFDAEVMKAGLVEAMARPVEATALGLSVRLERSGPGTFAVAMQIDPAGVVLEQQQDRWTGRVELAIAQRLPDGRLESSVYVTVPIDFTHEVRQRFLATGLTVHRTITLHAGARTLIVGARDGLSGSIGTVIVGAARVRRIPD